MSNNDKKNCPHVANVANHKRRDQLCIVADILLIASRGAKKTHIMYRANLSFTQLNEYLPFLEDSGLLNLTICNDGHEYTLSKKGRDFLRQHRELVLLLKNNRTKKTTRMKSIPSPTI